ncbi:SCO3374 family protein [Streptomyces rubrogriseus]|uniref:SCO3374 family protein n=1 Tax=Streptomyces rubrogriseus TaxID=194673 RepID=UPI0035667C5B
MVGASHSVPVAPASPVVPSPRRPTGNGGSARERTRWWYESVLGWPTAPGEPVRLRTGVRFDVLDVPTAAGYATLERLGWSGRGPQGFPVAVRGERMLLLVAAGGAEELPGLLEWLEWGSLALDLTAVGADGLVEAPLVPVVPEPRPAGPPRPPERDGVRGPPSGCGPRSRGAGRGPRCRRCRPSAAPATPWISSGWSAHWPRSATGSGSPPTAHLGRGR